MASEDPAKPGESRHIRNQSQGDISVPRLSFTKLVLLLGALVTIGAANFAMFKSMYNAYGEEHAYFVSQGVNLLYVVYGGVLVYPRYICPNYRPVASLSVKSKDKDKKKRKQQDNNANAQPKRVDRRWKFLVMGTLDCFGTFFTAMGAVYTPGVFQTLLNQTLIPCTMFFSTIFLRTKYKRLQIFGALVIVCGAIVSIGPAMLNEGESASKQFRWYACLIYFLSNVPMAMSSVYKELAFRNEKIDVLYLTQWVSIFQLLIGFLLAPLQALPGFGTPGTGFPNVPYQLKEGVWCFLELSKDCRNRNTMVLLPGYVAINFVFNTLGLYITKRSSAVLLSIGYALLLPVTTITFSLKIMGPYREKITPYTWLGLAMVILGFLIYRWRPLSSRRSKHHLKRTKSGGTVITRSSTGTGGVALHQVSEETSLTSQPKPQDSRESPALALAARRGVPQTATDVAAPGTPTPLCGGVLPEGLAQRDITEKEKESIAFQERTGMIPVVLYAEDSCASSVVGDVEGSPLPPPRLDGDQKNSYNPRQSDDPADDVLLVDFKHHHHRGLGGGLESSSFPPPRSLGRGGGGGGGSGAGGGGGGGGGHRGQEGDTTTDVHNYGSFS